MRGEANLRADIVRFILLFQLNGLGDGPRSRDMFCAQVLAAALFLVARDRARRPRSSFYFPHSSSSPQSSSASSHSFVFFSSAGAGLSLPLADPESTLPPPFDPDAAD